jgi:hypothetical protein
MEAAPSVDHRNLTSQIGTVLLVACLCNPPPFCREIRLMEHGAETVSNPLGLPNVLSFEVERPATAQPERSNVVGSHGHEVGALPPSGRIWPRRLFRSTVRRRFSTH